MNDGITIEAVPHGGPMVDRIYTDILRPSFPPDELAPLATLRAGVTAGVVTMIAAVDTFGAPHGVAVGEWSSSARVVTLNYLATAPNERSQGIGGRLLSAAISAWQRRYRPCVLLAEVERPDRHRASAQHGDPVARLRFYQRYGARALDVPHFQPMLSPETDRAYGMLLIVLHADAEFRADAERLHGEPVHRFLSEYLSAHEPGMNDPAGLALLNSARRSEGILLVDLDDYRRIAVSSV